MEIKKWKRLKAEIILIYLAYKALMPFHTSTPFQDGFLEQGCGVTPGITNGVAEACGRGTLSSFNNTETLQAHMQSTYKYVKAVSSS